MARLGPTPAFARVALETAVIAAASRYCRLYLEQYPDPLGFGKTPSRFSDPRRRAAKNRFGVLYLGASLKVCFLETLLRDKRNGVIGKYPLSEGELHLWRCAEIEVTQPLTLVDLRGDAGVRMGIPSDVARASDPALARAWSVALHVQPDAPDGIVYPSRLNGETNLAIYDHAICKLAVRVVTPLIAAAGLAHVLNDLKVAIVEGSS
jgi:hypothetical protein